jgi:cytochrome c biogenesis protein CcmG/thiol:disulfide interchange protein DsbE
MTDRMNLSKMITVLVLLLASVGIIWAVVNFGNKEVTVLEMGQPAPDFSLETVEGKTVKLSDYKGKVVAINFWATWCEDCRKEMPDLQKAYETYKDQGLVILGVNLKENNVTVKGFADFNGLTFPIVMDKDGKVTVDQYMVKPIPTTYFVDKQGILRAKVESAMSYEKIMNTVKPLLE